MFMKREVLILISRGGQRQDCWDLGSHSIQSPPAAKKVKATAGTTAKNVGTTARR